MYRNAPQQDDHLAMSLIQLTQMLIIVATLSGACCCLAHVRGWCARKEEVKERFCLLQAYAAIPQFVCSALAVIVWRCIQ